MKYHAYQPKTKHEKWAYRKGFFAAIDCLLKHKLSDSQYDKLCLCEGGVLYTIGDQLFLRYIDNRYSPTRDKEQILNAVKDCIETYRFLLNSNIEPRKIRYLFAKALMDVVSTGSGTYFLWWDAWYDQFWSTRNNDQCFLSFARSTLKLYRFWACYRTISQNMFVSIGEKYPNIRRNKIFKDDYTVRSSDLTYAPRFLWEQLLISYAYPYYLLVEKRGQLNIENATIDFFSRHKWCLERLSRCNPIFENKYKEKICEDLSYYLGKDPDIAYNFFIFPLWDKFDVPTDITFASTINHLILDCFSSHELFLFSETDEGGNSWDFGKQIRDRYRSKYPSFASFQDIKEGIIEIIGEHRSHLNSDTAEAVREIILDEIERIAFVSKPTHLWNLEMEANLNDLKLQQTNRNVVKAVDCLISYLPRGSEEYLALEKGGKRFSLREQLLARWKKAIFATDIDTLEQYLSKLPIYTPNAPGNWKMPPSRIDLQTFLGEVDMFFLYPRRGRRLKKLFSRLDTGRVIGGANGVERIYMSFKVPDGLLTCLYSAFFTLAIVVLVMVVISLWRRLAN